MSEFDSKKDMASIDAFVDFHGDFDDDAVDRFRREWNESQRPLAAFFNRRLTIRVGDITKQNVDAIVNAANSSLMGGGGVDGAIHRAAGPELLEECRTIRETMYPEGLPVGEAVITTGGDLMARYVIHTVGPIYRRNKEQAPELLASCYLNSLRLGQQKQFRRIAFPAISTGAYGYPPAEAARVVFSTLQDFLEHDRVLQEVCLLFLTREEAELFISVTGDLAAASSQLSSAFVDNLDEGD